MNINTVKASYSIKEAKAKANQFIKMYEKRVSEREVEKQKLKQKVIEEIISKRSSYNYNDQYANSRHLGKCQYSSKQSLSKKAESPAMNSKSENRKITQKYPVNAGETAQTVQFQQNNHAKEISKKEGLANQKKNYVRGEIKFLKGRDTNILIQREQLIKQLKKKQAEGRNQEGYQDESFQNKIAFGVDTIKISSPAQNKEIETKNTFSKKFKYVFPPQPSVQESDNQNQSSSEIVQSIQKISVDPKEKGLSLTVTEDQSIDMTEDQSQNLAFDIMEKSNVKENLEELKRKKIEELERKRQVRKEASQKRIQSEKKQQTSLSKFKYKASQKSQESSNNPEANLHRLKPKIPSRKRIISAQQKVNCQSQYDFLQTNRKKNNEKKLEDSSYRPGSFREIPKTTSSDNKLKHSRNSNILKQSSNRHEKSANKYSQQPKIQPKERKNTFIKQSNKKLMINAISNACLPGELNKRQRQKLLEVIENSDSEFFVFLFKEYSRKVIKAIYILDHTQTTLEKIYGEKAPQQLTAEQITSFYRFDSGARQFKKLDGCKSMSFVVHAIDVR